jgi:acid stress-induced BolA-like protein IbaG/YrbA
MGAPREVERSTHRIEELVFALDALADPAAADAARELVQRVLEMHGSALARIMATISADAGGARLSTLLAQDDGVSGVLLLHGLHPLSFEARIRGALDRLHPHLGVQGVAVQDVEVDGDGVRLRLVPGDAGRYHGGNADAVARQVRQALMDAAPDASAIEIEGPPAHLSFVAVSSITVGPQVGSAAGAAR